MTELFRHIGSDSDIPAGDIGVGTREIGYLFGQYRRLTAEFSGVMTGKAVGWGGSLIRPEATGYGAVYFAVEMLKTRGMSLESKRCLISGSGNVAQYTAKKLIELGATPITLSDSDGFVHDPDGIDADKLQWVMELKNSRRGRIREYAEEFGASYFPGRTPWEVPCDAAFPSATQNEIDETDAKSLVKNGCILVAEGANMPTSNAGAELFLRSGVLFGPAKAANAGGVATSGLEMSQNAMRLSWPAEEVDSRLRSIMRSIHVTTAEAAEEYGYPNNYVMGANIAGFRRVADAMIDQGLV